MTHDLLNTLNNSLKNLNDSIRKKIDSSIVDNFINELQDYLSKLNSSTLISNLRPYSLLTFAKYDKDFAVCFDYKEKKIYYVPKNSIIGNKPEPGEALKVNPNGTFYVDYTAIPANENKIDEYLQECK